MFTRTLVSGLIATTVAATMLVGTVQPSAAHSHHHHDLGIGIAAGVGGFVLGTCSPSSPAPSMSTKTAARGTSAAASTATQATIRTQTPMSATTATVTTAGSERRWRFNQLKEGAHGSPFSVASMVAGACSIGRLSTSVTQS